jgi:protein TonB
MNWIRLAALFLAIGVHAGLVCVLLSSAPGDTALQEGHGNDELTTVATVTMDDGETFGRDLETKAEQNFVAAQQKEEAKPEPEKPEEAPTPPAEMPPLKEAETSPPPPHPEAKAQPTPQIDPEEEQRTANRALEGRRTALASAYLSEVYSSLGRHKVRPQSNRTGHVLVSLTIAPSGQIVSHDIVESSGSDALDRAAIGSLEKAAPFPPLPKGLSDGPYTVIVPFEYSTR